MTFEAILKDLQNKIYKPIYLLSGDEPYYIDVITEYIEKNVLTDSEKSFNQTIVYGRDVNANDIINYCKRYPMMANNQVVIIKEAQDLDDFDKLLPYFENPLNSTLLVINYRYKKFDSRKKIAKIANKIGATLVTVKLYDNQIPKAIEGVCNELNIKIEPKAVGLLAEYLGSNLSKIRKEIEKLKVSIERKSDTITSNDVEKNIGISKEYNIFEIQKMLGKKDILKTNKAAIYLGNNTKGFNHPIPAMGNLFNFFQKVFTYHLLKDKSKNNVASKLGVNPFFVQDYQTAARNYHPRKIVEIFSLLREYDLKAKGVNATALQPIDLWKELFYKIMH